MIEFAVVFPIVLLVVVGFLASALSAIETINAVNVAETAALTASQAAGTSSATAVDLGAVPTVIPRLQSGLFGTTVQWKPGRWCPSLPPSPTGTVDLCASQPTTGPDAGLVVVQIDGRPDPQLPLVGLLDRPLRVAAAIAPGTFAR